MIKTKVQEINNNNNNNNNNRYEHQELVKQTNQLEYVINPLILLPISSDHKQINAFDLDDLSI